MREHLTNGEDLECSIGLNASLNNGAGRKMRTVSISRPPRYIKVVTKFNIALGIGTVILFSPKKVLLEIKGKNMILISLKE